MVEKLFLHQPMIAALHYISLFISFVIRVQVNEHSTIICPSNMKSILFYHCP